MGSGSSKIVALLKQIKGVQQCDYAGSLRQRKEIIGDIDILMSAPDKLRNGILSAFMKQEDVESIVASGDTKSTVILKNGIQCDLRIVSESEYPFTLNYFTGSRSEIISPYLYAGIGFFFFQDSHAYPETYKGTSG